MVTEERKTFTPGTSLTWGQVRLGVAEPLSLLAASCPPFFPPTVCPDTSHPNPLLPSQHKAQPAVHALPGAGEVILTPQQDLTELLPPPGGPQPLPSHPPVLLPIPRPGEFPGGPVVKTPHWHCRGMGPIPGLGTKILQAS